MPVIIVEGLEHAYGDRSALRGLNFRVDAGEVFGLLGPNGAGKSTTVGILTSQIVPSSGGARILRRSVASEGSALRANIGLAAQDVRLSGHLSVEETLTFYGILYGLSGEKLEVRVSYLLSLLELEDRKVQAVKELSEGLKRRVNLALALVHNPPVIFLDEPTTGLDPRSRHTLWRIIRQLKGEGKTIFLTTHYMDEAETLCDRIAIIDAGKIVALGSPEDLKATLGAGKVVEMEADCDDTAIETYEMVVGKGNVLCEGGISIMTDDPKEVVRRLLEDFLDVENAQLRVRDPSLEDVFLKLTGRRITEDGDAEEVAQVRQSHRSGSRFLRLFWPRLRRMETGGE
ncbi:MAG: ABC transporter ATP-binding protein [Candidatus Geothermarchaeales archaeon]